MDISLIEEKMEESIKHIYELNSVVRMSLIEMQVRYNVVMIVLQMLVYTFWVHWNEAYLITSINTHLDNIHPLPSIAVH